MNPRHILIFSLAYEPLVGGAEIAVREITDRVPSDKTVFDMITLRFSPEHERYASVGNVRLVRVGNPAWGLRLNKILFPLYAFFAARRLQRTVSYDAVWGIMANYAGIAAALFKLFFPKVPFVLTLQEGDDESHLERYVFRNETLYKLLIQPLHRFPMRKADYVTVISNYLRQRALEGGAKVPIELIPNGVDVALFGTAYPEEDIWHLKESLGKSPDEKMIVTVSRLVVKNGVDTLIDALSYLPDTKLLVVGTGPDLAELVLQVEKKKMADQVTFLGQQSYKDIPKYLAASDVFVRLSRSEGFGNVFIEAMAAGIPVVATPVGGIVDFLKNEENGLLVPADDPKAAANAIRNIFDNQPVVARLVEAGRKTAAEYDWKNIARKMEDVFEKVFK